MLLGRYRFLTTSFSAALLLAVLPAYASTVSYADPTAWAAATTATTMIDFAGLAPAGGVKDYNTSTGLVIDGVSFVGYWNEGNNVLEVVDQNHVSPWWNWNVPATLQSPTYNLPAKPTFIPYVRVVLPSNTTAFATGLASLSPGLNYQITLSDGEVFTAPTYDRPTLSFFGVTSEDPIAFVDFTLLDTGVYSGSVGLMADFQFGATGTGGSTGGDPGDTPEACTLILIGSGLVGMRTFRKHLPKFSANLQS